MRDTPENRAEARNRAVRLLSHYILSTMKKVGLKTDGDNRAEIEMIVDDIIFATVGDGKPTAPFTPPSTPTKTPTTPATPPVQVVQGMEPPKPCPFCGKEGESFHNHGVITYGCSDCRISGDAYNWNIRA